MCNDCAAPVAYGVAVVTGVAPWEGSGGPRLLGDDIADRLVTAISVGMYSPGERLPAERELAEHLGVGRDALRRGIKQVAELGLLESRRGRSGGTFVTDKDWRTIASDVVERTFSQELPRLEDLRDFRCLIEGTIARTAARRREADDVAVLEETLHEFAQAESMEEARALDHRLHGLVARAARNIHLGELSRDLTERATLGLGAEPYPQEYYERALEDHVELIGHVVAGREEEAARAAEVHFSLTLEIMVDALHSARDSMRE